MEPTQILKEVAAQVAECKNCPLSYARKKSVPGDGPASAQIMMIGEGPGFYENEQGRPFVGPAGGFLDELLEKAGVNRKEVFITNVVKCRPPGNRDPLPEELLACGGYLDRQIEAVNPLIIVTLGRYSMAKFLPNVKISEVHGKPVWVRGRLVLPMFHPAAALHQASLRPTLERDFARLPEWITQARQGGRQAEAARGSVESASGRSEAGGIAESGLPYAQSKDKAAKSKILPPEQPGLGLFDQSLPNDPPATEEDQARPDKPTQLSLF